MSSSIKIILSGTRLIFTSNFKNHHIYSNFMYIRNQVQVSETAQNPKSASLVCQSPVSDDWHQWVCWALPGVDKHWALLRVVQNQKQNQDKSQAQQTVLGIKGISYHLVKFSAQMINTIAQISTLCTM